jgi:hypothetical protein
VQAIGRLGKPSPGRVGLQAASPKENVNLSQIENDLRYVKMPTLTCGAPCRAAL